MPEQKQEREQVILCLQFAPDLCRITGSHRLVVKVQPAGRTTSFQNPFFAASVFRDSATW